MELCASVPATTKDVQEVACQQKLINIPGIFQKAPKRLAHFLLLFILKESFWNNSSNPEGFNISIFNELRMNLCWLRLPHKNISAGSGNSNCELTDRNNSDAKHTNHLATRFHKTDKLTQRLSSETTLRTIYTITRQTNKQLDAKTWSLTTRRLLVTSDPTNGVTQRIQEAKQFVDWCNSSGGKSI